MLFNEKTKEFFKNNFGYIVVALTCTVYIMTAFLSIDATGKTVAQIIGDGAVAFFLGIFINRIFELQGMVIGEKDERMIEARKNHSDSVDRIAPYIDLLDVWCDEENAKNLRLQRTRILASAGIKYETCFDEDGLVLAWHPTGEAENKSLYKRQKHAYEKAATLKLTLLFSGELTGEGGKGQDPFFFGRSKGQYERQTGIEDVVIKFGTAGVFGYYGVSLIENFNYAHLIWVMLQVSLFLCMGVIKMIQARMFITDEYRLRIIKKTAHLQKFENHIKKEDLTNGEPKQSLL